MYPVITEERVRRFAYGLEPQTRAKIARCLIQLERFGYALGMPHSKKISQDLFELRICGKQEIRIFYAFRNGFAVLIHGFIKKTQQIPPQEIRTAQLRLKSFDAL